MSITDYGFRWGPATVTRLMTAKRGNRTNYLLGVETEHRRLEVSISGAGHSVRVWLDGDELHNHGKSGGAR